jgi:hypothetical protein
MGMERLRSQSPEMAGRELLMFLIGHNVIQCLMAEAVARHQVDLERVSFKGTVDGARQYSAAILETSSRKLRQQLWDDLLLNPARDLVPYRPTRSEPPDRQTPSQPLPLPHQTAASV